MKVEYAEPAKNDPSCEIRLGTSSWDASKKSIKYAWTNSDGKIARGGEIPVEALPQMLDFAVRKKYLPAGTSNASNGNGAKPTVGKRCKAPTKKNVAIEQVIDEYRESSPSSPEAKKRIMKNYRRDLIAAGMSEEEADEEVDTWDNTTWTNDDWRNHYGLDADDVLE